MQIDAVTRFDHRGAIGMSHGKCGCYLSVKPQLQNLNDNLIIRMKNQPRITSLPCTIANTIFNRRFDENKLDIFQFEASLPKTALISKIDSVDLMKLRSVKSNRRMKNLEKAQRVNFLC